MRSNPEALGGPERETVLERFVDFFQLPYPIAALLLAVVAGSPTFYLGQYLDTGTTTTALADLRNFQTHEYMERKAESIRTWPFDLQVFEAFLGIIPVTAILLLRVLQIALHL
jgi:hypothetical protein